MNYIVDLIKEFVSGNVISVSALIIVILSAFFEISKFKINPISSTLRWIGNKLNQTQNENIEKLGKKVDDLCSDFEDHKIESQRAEILTFANQEMRGQKHTKEEFDHIIRVHDSYDKYIQEHKLKNGQVTIAYNYISDIYKKYLNENGFL